MFIKKDKRKINEILKEEGTKLDTLKLSMRTAEFQGTLRIICQETKIKLLCNLRVLNLYDNALTNVDGIGMLSQTPIEEINLGCNKLDKLPLEVSRCINHACVRS
jgi:Leucine-rich repeat (LRR) protein